MIVDQLTDPAASRTLVRCAADKDFLSRAASTDVTPALRGELPAEAFAWREARLFPVHEPGHAALSAYYAGKQAAVPDEVRTAIKYALDLYGVKPPEPPAPPAPAPKQAQWLHPAGHLPANSRAELRRSIDEVDRARTKVGVHTRAQVAQRTIEACTLYNEPVPEFAERWAGLRECDTRKLAAQVLARAEMTALPGCAEAYRKLAEDMLGQPRILRDRPLLVRAADALHALDKQAGLEPRYARDLLDPLEAVFCGDKLAEDMLDLGGGTLVSRGKAAELPMSFYQDALGPDFADQMQSPEGNFDVERAEQVLPTLPPELRRYLGQQMNQFGGAQ